MPRSVKAPFSFCGLDHHRAGAVAEQHASRAVLPIEDAREGLGADHQRALELTAFQVIVGGGQGKHEARADRLHVEGCAMGDAELGLDGHGGGRERSDPASRWQG